MFLHTLSLLAVSAMLTEPLEWLYPDSSVGSVTRLTETDVPSNGVAEANVLLNGLAAGTPVSFSSSVPGGEFFRLVDVAVVRNTGLDGGLERGGVTNAFVTRRAPFRAYDAMEPLEGGSFVPTNATAALRFRLKDFGGRTGALPVRIAVGQGAFSRELDFRVNVHAAAVPPVGRDSFKYTNWLGCWWVCKCHGLQTKCWGPEHRDLIRRYVRLAVHGRQNMVLVPIFDLGLDERRIREFVEMVTAEGIHYLEGAHLASFSTGNWGAPAFVPRGSTNLTTSAAGTAKLEKMAADLYRIIERNGWKDRWYQHVADEPSARNEAEFVKTCAIVRRQMPGVRLLDAIETTKIAGALDAYCPKNDQYEKNRAAYGALKTRPTDELWCYTCMFPGGKWMNRLIDQELLRPVLLPWGCRLFGLDGYLHWGFNQYGPENDPLRFGYAYDLKAPYQLPPGDSNIVYAGPKGPWPSVRLEAMRQGMEDLELLRMLAADDPKAADALVGRLVRGFGDYETSVRTYRAVRRELLGRVGLKREKGRETK